MAQQKHTALHKSFEGVFNKERDKALRAYPFYAH